MNFQRRKSTAVVLLSAMLTVICLLTASGCATVLPEDLVSESNTVVSAANLTSPSDAAKAAVTSGSDLTAPTTLTAAQTTAETTETTWNDEHPYVPYSRTKYKIVVYIGSQSTVVYSPNEDGEYTEIVKCFTCSTGASATPTDTGIYRARAKYRWRFMNGVYGQYCTSISTRYLFHSIPYKKKDVSTLNGTEYDKLGSPASHGCIRMCSRDCKWIYDNIPLGTEVHIVKDSGPSGPGVPSRNHNSLYDGWDPSDRWAQGNPYFS